MAGNSMNSRRKRPGRKRRYRNAYEIEQANKRAFKEAAWMQRECRVCRDMGPWEAHHVVEKRKLKFEGRRDLLWDTRNAMRLCPECHRRHTIRSKVIELRLLTDEHFEFAFYALGAGAHYYLGQMYIGEDSRLDQYLEKWEEEYGDGSTEPGIAAGF